MQDTINKLQIKSNKAHINNENKFNLNVYIAKCRAEVQRIENNIKQVIQDTAWRNKRQVQKQNIENTNRHNTGGKGANIKCTPYMQQTVANLLSLDPKNAEVLKNRSDTALQLFHSITYDKLTYLQGLYWAACEQQGYEMKPTQATTYIINNIDKLDMDATKIYKSIATPSAMSNCRAVGKSRTIQAQKIRSGPGMGLFHISKKHKNQQVGVHIDKRFARDQMYSIHKFIESLSEELRNETVISGIDCACTKKCGTWEGDVNVKRNDKSITTIANVQNNKFGTGRSNVNPNPKTFVKPVVLVVVEGEYDAIKDVLNRCKDRIQLCTVAPTSVNPGKAADMFNIMEHGFTTMCEGKTVSKILHLKHDDHQCKMSIQDEILLFKVQLRIKLVTVVQCGFKQARDQFLSHFNAKDNIELCKNVMLIFCNDILTLMKTCLAAITTIIANLSKTNQTIFYKIIKEITVIMASIITLTCQISNLLKNCNINGK